MNTVFLTYQKDKFFRKENSVTIDTKIKQEDTIEVILKFDKRIAYRVYDEFPNEKIINKDDFLFVTALLPNNDTLYSYVLSFEDCIEIIKPQEEKEAMKSRIKKIQEKYRT